MRAAWLLLPLALGACANRQTELMPLHVGATWTYTLNSLHGGESLQTLTVEREIAIGGARGYELSSGTGRSALAWNKGVLLASELAGTRYEPPLPLLPREERMDWSGTVVLNGERLPASATATRTDSSLELKNQRRDTVLVEHSIRIEGRPEMTVSTHFAAGTGILEQRQTLDGDLVLRMAFESGP